MFKLDKAMFIGVMTVLGIIIVALAAPGSIRPIMILVLGVVVYFAPSLIAENRRVPNVGSVFVINLFLGWTLIGWVVALAMAARSVPTGSPTIERRP